MVEFVETAIFRRLVGRYLADDEYMLLQQYLSTNSLAGSVIPGTGGVRKLRWAGGVKGKRAGLRLIYYRQAGHDRIWLLTIYGKSVATSIPAHLLRKIREEIENVG